MKTLYGLRKEAIRKYGVDNVRSITNARNALITHIINDVRYREGVLIGDKDSLLFPEALWDEVIGIIKK